MQLIMTSDGAPGSTTNRVSSANATSFFIDTEIRAGNWILTPGLRFEDIDMLRLDYSTNDPTRSQGPSRVRENEASVFIPGMGALYKINPNWRLLAGIHKGFNPPAPGSNVDEESSINYELGTRYNSGNFAFESIYFYNDYDNLVGTVTASTGGGGEIGDQFDGGAVTVQGLELTTDYQFNGLMNGKLDLPLSFQYTWTTEAEFKSAFDSNFDPWGDVQVGDQLQQFFFFRIGGERVRERLESHLLAGFVFVFDVHRRGRVFAHQHHRQAGNFSRLLLQHCDFRRHLFLDIRRNFFAVDQGHHIHHSTLFNLGECRISSNAPSYQNRD
jgi:hypothetical protein